MNRMEFVERHSENLCSRYEHEAMTKGCKIYDYGHFHRQTTIDVMLLIGVLGFYVLIGLVVGIIVGVNIGLQLS